MSSISRISFGSNDKIANIQSGKRISADSAQKKLQIPQFMLEQDRPHRRVNNDMTDVFISQLQEQQAKAKKENIIKTVLAFLAGMAVAGGTAGAVNMQKSVPDDVAVIYNPSGDSIEELSDIYGTDENLIRLYNEIPQDSELSEITQITIPSEYDNVQEEIDKEQDKLYNKNLSEEKRSSIEENIWALKEKQAMQKEVASAYTDGDYVYFSINDIEALPQYQDGINVEDFKKLYDIKDGAIQKYNSLDDCQWHVGEDGKGGTIDFTKSYLHSGKIIKVKTDDIIDEIDLSDFVSNDDIIE